MNDTSVDQVTGQVNTWGVAAVFFYRAESCSDEMGGGWGVGSHWGERGLVYVRVGLRLTALNLGSALNGARPLRW